MGPEQQGGGDRACSPRKKEKKKGVAVMGQEKKGEKGRSPPLQKWA